MDIRKSSLKYELLLLAMSIIWGSTFVAQQIGMAKGVGPMTYNGLRFTLGCLSLIPVILWRKKYVVATEENAKFPILGSLIAGLFLFGAASFQQIGLQYTTSANSGFITGFYILFVPLLGLFLGQKISKSVWAVIPVCLFGFYLLSVTSDFKISKGDVLTLVCALLWAGQILVIDRVARNGDPLQIACLQFALCAVLSVLSGLAFETCTLAQVKAASGAIAYGGLMSVGIAFTLQVICQKRCPPAPAAIIMSLEAVFAAIAGYLVLNQELTVRAILGCVLIFVGVVMAQLLPLLKRAEGGDQKS
jgi:drug/metabolite transporter (DMT)-like permease